MIFTKATTIVAAMVFGVKLRFQENCNQKSALVSSEFNGFNRNYYYGFNGKQLMLNSGICNRNH